MPTSLEDLPLEIRQRIYSLVLVESKEMNIQVYDAQGQEIHLGVARLGHRRNPKHRGQRWSGNKWVSVVSSDTGLLKASKQIHAEAVPMFYGKNVFAFRSTNALDRFLNQIGDMKAHLRYLELPHFAFFTRRSHASAHYAVHRSLKTLVAATNLRSLTISHYYFCPSRRTYNRPEMALDYDRCVQQFVKHCKPLLNSLKTSYEAQNLLANVLDFVTVDGPKHGHCQCTIPTRLTNHNKIVALLREEITTQLNLPRG